MVNENNEGKEEEKSVEDIIEETIKRKENLKNNIRDMDKKAGEILYSVYNSDNLGEDSDGNTNYKAANKEEVQEVLGDEIVEKLIQYKWEKLGVEGKNIEEISQEEKNYWCYEATGELPINIKNKIKKKGSNFNKEDIEDLLEDIREQEITVGQENAYGLFDEYQNETLRKILKDPDADPEKMSKREARRTMDGYIQWKTEKDKYKGMEEQFNDIVDYDTTDIDYSNGDDDLLKPAA